MKIKGKVLSVNKEVSNDNEVTKVEFENSVGKKVEYLIFFDTINKVGSIIRNGIDYAGLNFDNKNRLIDYDMVFELTKYAIIAIRKAGLTVPREFENNY